MADPGISAGGASPQADDMRVVTLNLWGRRGAWAERRSVLVDGLRELRPDLVAFQEAIRTGEYDQVIDLLDAGFHVAHQTSREADGQGVSIASRWPLGEVRAANLNVTPRTGDFACTTLVAEILAPEPVGPCYSSTTYPIGNWTSSMRGSGRP